MSLQATPLIAPASEPTGKLIIPIGSCINSNALLTYVWGRLNVWHISLSLLQFNTRRHSISISPLKNELKFKTFKANVFCNFVECTFNETRTGLLSLYVDHRHQTSIISLLGSHAMIRFGVLMPTARCVNGGDVYSTNPETRWCAEVLVRRAGAWIWDLKAECKSSRWPTSSLPHTVESSLKSIN